MIRNLDIAAMRSFLAVAEMGGVTRAATQLNLTQSAVSLQIKRLEELFGQPLFERTGRGVTLTAQGEQLVGYARRLLAANDETWSRMTEPAQFAGEINLGSPDDLLYPARAAGDARLRAVAPAGQGAAAFGADGDAEGAVRPRRARCHPDHRGRGWPGRRGARHRPAGLDRRARRRGVAAPAAAARYRRRLHLQPRGDREPERGGFRLEARDRLGHQPGDGREHRRRHRGAAADAQHGPGAVRDRARTTARCRRCPSSASTCTSRRDRAGGWPSRSRCGSAPPMPIPRPSRPSSRRRSQRRP